MADTTDPQWTDYRARIVAVLRAAYTNHGRDIDQQHGDAADAVLGILRDLTRDLSEEVARLRLADADRAARDSAEVDDFRSQVANLQQQIAESDSTALHADGYRLIVSLFQERNQARAAFIQAMRDAQPAAPVPASPVAVEGAEPVSAPETETASGDCRSLHGITVGLIDGLIATCRVLAARDLITDRGVIEALTDLRQDEDVRAVVGGAGSDAQGGDR
jgi:hypothetical protein